IEESEENFSEITNNIGEIEENSSEITKTDNDDMIESRLIPPLPLNKKKLSNERLLANNKRFKKLNYELQEILSEFEAAIWLAKYSHILDLAFEIYNTISQTLENSQESSPKLKFSLSDR
ncbi:25816_t:CDS:2, partial [Racocetra persica]